ncbi:NERD domain-containing protein, partial [Alkalihalophilus pseudofirmus]|nr:NERD domain-containing protein [Alkalihalophilus pseudofirmus]
MPKPRKLRHIPKELLILRYLNIRMMLLDQDRKNLYNAEKGLEGEVKFDQLTEQLQSEGIVINGLLLKLDNHFFQID